MLTNREFQVTVILGIVAYIVFRGVHHINVWRLTPSHVPRQFFISFEPGSFIAVLGACLAGPIAGLVFGVVAWNPVIRPDVLVIVKAAQFVVIGYLHKKIQSPYNILAIPVGTIITLIVHPTLVQYIMYRKVYVHLYWYQNLAFQTAVTFTAYMLLRLVTPQLFSWVYPKVDYSLKIPLISRIKNK